MSTEPCPCPETVSDCDKSVLSFGLTNEMLRNPNAAAIAGARQLGGANGARIADLIQRAQTGGALNALPSLQRMQSVLTDQERMINAFENECNKFTSVQGLMSIVSNLSLYANLTCALGIPGLDIGAGLNVINANGQTSIQGALAANVDLERVLNSVGDGAGTDLAESLEGIQGALGSVADGIDAVNAQVDGLMNEAANVLNEAASFIQKYTDISSLANLVNLASTDPCFKLGSVINGSVISPDFLNAVRGVVPPQGAPPGTPNPCAGTGFGVPGGFR